MNNHKGDRILPAKIMRPLLNMAMEGTNQMITIYAIAVIIHHQLSSSESELQKGNMPQCKLSDVNFE